tara:strand:- start:164 stop:403 length:240 start_codon:yes stop_codon:yes gene_type:complete
MEPIHSLIKDSLKQQPLGQSKNFEWFITDIGIVAILNDQYKSIATLDPIKEALELDLDLSKEERQIIRLDEKEILLFYS